MNENHITQFNNDDFNDMVAELYLIHLKGLNPEDYKVGVLALGRVASILEQSDYGFNDRESFERIMVNLQSLTASYSDSSGQYTSGKGEIGSFIIDFERLMKTKLWPRVHGW